MSPPPPSTHVSWTMQGNGVQIVHSWAGGEQSVFVNWKSVGAMSVILSCGMWLGLGEEIGLRRRAYRIMS